MSKTWVASGAVFVAVSFAGYVVGCKSSDDGTSSGGDRLAAEGDGKTFCEHTLGSLSGAFDACCTASDQAAPEYRLSHGIVVALEPACATELERSISKQRVQLHPSDANSCYAAYAARFGGGDKCRNLTTTFSDPAGPSCRNAFTGAQAAGAACAGDHECQNGLTCVGATTASDGTCQTPPAIGSPCGAGVPDGGASGSTSLEFGSHPACAAGAYCSPLHQCVARVPAGEPCRFSDDALSGCAESLQCHLGKCSPDGPSDTGACLSNSDCTPGHYCAVPSGTQSGQCTELESAGGSCKANYGFQSECKGRCDAEGAANGTCATFCGSE